MSLPILILLLLAAALHAGWNMLLKQSGEKYVLLWWAAILTALLALPVVLLGGSPGLEIWPFVILSALTEVAYMVTLAYAYNQSDFSLVYPIARGTAPAFLVIWSVLFLGDRPSWLGGTGLAILICGLILVGSSDWLAHRGQAQPSRRGVALALSVALLISIYSTIDGAAVQRTDPTFYTVLVLGMTGPLFTPFILRRYPWKTIRRVLRTDWRRILLIAGASLLTYILVLNVYALAPVSYAGAIREVSIVFAALAGWRLLGEELGKVRILGSVVIFSGILLIAIAK
jgi:drug/metabolite transporter (DMT)-like permease